MKPKQIHEEAMELSFKAKQAISNREYQAAADYYGRAADKEGELARFYFDKPELEPTRSLIVRGAAFLYLKAGLIKEAQEFIFWGLLYLNDSNIKKQLEEALELTVALKNVDVKTLGNADYFRLLRMRSINYTMEPREQHFGHLISLEMFKDFAGDYLRSLRAYADAAFLRTDTIVKKAGSKLGELAEQFEELINPLITTSGIGSFTFGIANDFLSRGEQSELVELKAEVIINYHEKVFTNPLNDSDIDILKKEYNDEEISQIFRPISRIKSANSPYKVAYFDIENYGRRYVPQMIKEQRKKLLPLNPPSLEDIGELESSIIHARRLTDGKKKRNVIQKEQLKTYELEFKTSQIEPKDMRPLPLNGSIVIEVNFDAAIGFTFSYEELGVIHTATDYKQGLQAFYGKFYERLLEIIRLHFNGDKSIPEWDKVGQMLNNPQSLIN